MCNYIYKEFSCQHHYHVVESWCSKYIDTERRCPPTVVSKQYWDNDICSTCRERQQPRKHPWANLVRPPQPRWHHVDACCRRSRAGVEWSAGAGGSSECCPHTMRQR